MVDYNTRAKPVKISGHRRVGLSYDVHEYDSTLEGRAAQVWLQHGIKFYPHVELEVIDREGMPFTYEADFVFEEPQDLRMTGGPVHAYEVKGVLDPYDSKRKEALEYTHDINMWLGTPAHVQLLYEHGPYSKDADPILPEQRQRQANYEDNDEGTLEDRL